MIKRRFPALALAGAMTLSLAACGPKTPDSTPEPTQTPNVTESVQPTQTPEVVTPEPQPTESVNIVTPPVETDAVVKPLESQGPVQSHPIETVPAPSETPSEAPAETSKVQAAWDKISQRELPYFQDLDDTILSDFYGVDPADLVEYICKIPFMNTQATELFIAQVQPGKLDTVKSALEARQDTLAEQWSQYLPDQLELVKNYQLVTNGDYILFVIADGAGDMVSDFNACTK